MDFIILKDTLGKIRTIKTVASRFNRLKLNQNQSVSSIGSKWKLEEEIRNENIVSSFSVETLSNSWIETAGWFH